MQSSSGDHNEQDHYSLSFPTSQASFYNVSQSSIPGLLRLVNTPPMGLPSASAGGLPSLTGHGGYIPGSGLKRTAHDVGFLDQPKCEATADSDKYITSHSALSQQTVQSKNHQSSAHTPMKKTKGRVKIKMEFIDNKLRRYTTFSKRKTGIMKKAYELSTLTGTQVMLLVASETGHVYTFATRKLQPMITSEAGKALIQTCLNSPDPPPLSSTASAAAHGGDQRMSATGFEETELCYTTVNDDEQKELEDGDYAEDDDDSDAEKPAVAAGDHNSFNNGTVTTLHNVECVPGSSAAPMTRPQSLSTPGCTTVVASAAGMVTTASSVLTNQLLMDQLNQHQQLTALQLAVGHIPSTRLSRLTPPPPGTSAANDSPFSCGVTGDGSVSLDGGLVSDGLLMFGSTYSSIPAQPVKPENAGSPPPLSSSPTDLSKSKIMHGNL